MNFLRTINGHDSASQEEHWIPLSDLMTGLMLMFILVALTFMIEVEAESKKTKELQIKAEEQAQQLQEFVTFYDKVRERLYEHLKAEFQADLPRWKAVLDPDMTIRFEEPEGQFKTAQSTLSEDFKAILNDFIPRYVSILASDAYRASIEEIRIEGHTSSFWNRGTSELDAYMRNMELSQSRTRTTLEHVLTRPGLSEDKAWLRSKLTANGLSSSRLRYTNGVEDAKASQRVEFRVRLNADARMKEMLNRVRQ